MVEVLCSIGILHLYFAGYLCLPQEIPETDYVSERQGNTETFKAKTHIFWEDSRRKLFDIITCRFAEFSTYCCEKARKAYVSEQKCLPD
jgi:hypothetical protein